KVFVSFVVEKNGTLTDVQITRGLTKETDDEAIRVLSKSPRWNPGLVSGKPVRVKYNINVNFKMD
ncbi:energy transducer TonB, partial [Pedobacter miscanthi]|uniref:energy transducer TonB n=1 Tax=Pedobacter miscanthi TaxID=2259170 RepID=UPI002931B3DA